MRIDSCRACGGNMQEFQSCPDCKECIQFICKYCRKVGEPQIHPNCKVLEIAIAN